MACKKLFPCKAMHCLRCNGVVREGKARTSEVVSLECRACGHVELMAGDILKKWIELGLAMKVDWTAALGPADD